ncbi:MAG TPA: hypothetical protein PLO78_10185 [Candidatus Omnitrophota bacterium]|nr:hypothetical protein [Candidatus Omnitrophota bacterium]
MRQNFRGNKRCKEAARKKKQEEKRNKRLQKHALPTLQGPAFTDSSDNITATQAIPQTKIL